MSDPRVFKGLLPAFPTATNADGSVNSEVMGSMVRFMVEGGADGLVPMGGTGEFSALTLDARAAAVEATIAAAQGVPVVPGVIAPGFGDAVETGKRFQSLGAKGLMVIAPFYLSPSQSGIRDYFKAYRDAVDLPIIMYDIPRFTNTLVEPETIAQMVDDGSINGIKACNTDFNHFMKVVQLCGDRMSVLSGEDRFCSLHMALGAVGGVLASATLVPKHWKGVMKILAEGTFQQALAEQNRLLPLFDAIYREKNPGPLKRALQLLGIEAGDPLLPLHPVTDETRRQLQRAIDQLRDAKILEL